MPSPPDLTVDERFEELAAQLRGSRPQATDELRDRVRAIAAAEPEPKRRRRLGLVLVPALLIAFAAAIVGLGQRGTSSSSESAGGGQTAVSEEATRDLGAPAQAVPSDRALRAAGSEAATLPPARSRAQDYRAELLVRVRNLDDLSAATSEAMRATRRLGGFIVAARYDTPGDGDGDSLLVVRVPVGRVQEAILRFSQLGTIVGQSIAIEDLQAGLDRQGDAIAALQRTIATLEEELGQPGLTDEARAELRRRLVEARRSLAARERARDNTVRRAATARVSLTLTTRTAERPVEPQQPGYFERTLRDAASLLVKVLAWMLAFALVLTPFLMLAAVALVLERRRRRRSAQTLLERS
ncbi:MAG: DUF4349 domain-containing protein [Gaiellaceae bacterium]